MFRFTILNMHWLMLIRIVKCMGAAAKFIRFYDGYRNLEGEVYVVVEHCFQCRELKWFGNHTSELLKFNSVFLKNMSVFISERLVVP